MSVGQVINFEYIFNFWYSFFVSGPTTCVARTSEINCETSLASLFTNVLNASDHLSHGLFEAGCELPAALCFGDLKVVGSFRSISR